MLTLEFDTLSLLLLTVTILLALYIRSDLSLPHPLIHPLLLARQSEPSTTRRKHTSAIYRNWGTGHGAPLPTRPSGGLGLVSDLVDSNPDGMDSVRGRQMFHGILDLFPEAVEGRSRESPTILVHAPTVSTTDTAQSDNTKSVVELAALHLCTSLSDSMQLLLLNTPAQLPHALRSEHHDTPSLFFCRLPLLHDVLDHLISYKSSLDPTDPAPRFGIIVADVPLLSQSSNASPYTTLSTLASAHNVILVTYWDVLHAGSARLTRLIQEDKFGDLTPAEIEDRTKRAGEYARMFGNTVMDTRKGGAAQGDRFLKGEGRNAVGDVHAITYGPEGKVHEVTNENITSSLTSLLSLFPASHRPTPSLPSPSTQGAFRSLLPGGGPTPAPITRKKFRDVYLVDERLDSALGMGLLFLGLWTSQDQGQKTQLMYLGPEQTADVRTWVPNSTGKWASGVSPTLVFIHKDRLEQLVISAKLAAEKIPLYGYARRSKLLDLQHGYLSRGGWLWSRLVWKSVWCGADLGGVGKDLRGIVVIGDPPSQHLVREAQIHLSVPICRAYISPLSSGPLFASHFHDFQDLGGDQDEAIHVGPPTNNVEVILKGEGVEEVEIGGDPRGRLWVRGPGTLRELGKELDDVEDGWCDLGASASVQTNGTFRIL